jgi:hypothetical protein
MVGGDDDDDNVVDKRKKKKVYQKVRYAPPRHISAYKYQETHRGVSPEFGNIDDDDDGDGDEEGDDGGDNGYIFNDNRKYIQKKKRFVNGNESNANLLNFTNQSQSLRVASPVFVQTQTSMSRVNNNSNNNSIIGYMGASSASPVASSASDVLMDDIYKLVRKTDEEFKTALRIAESNK